MARRNFADFRLVLLLTPINQAHRSWCLPKGRLGRWLGPSAGVRYARANGSRPLTRKNDQQYQARCYLELHALTRDLAAAQHRPLIPTCAIELDPAGSSLQRQSKYDCQYARTKLETATFPTPAKHLQAELRRCSNTVQGYSGK